MKMLRDTFNTMDLGYDELREDYLLQEYRRYQSYLEEMLLASVGNKYHEACRWWSIGNNAAFVG